MQSATYEAGFPIRVRAEALLLLARNGNPRLLWHEQSAVDQRLAVVGLDHLPAVIAGAPRSPLDRIRPAWTEAAAEVAPHERMFA